MTRLVLAVIAAAVALASPGARAQAPSGAGAKAPSDAGAKAPLGGTVTQAPPANVPPAARQVAQALLPQDQWNRLLDASARALSQQVQQALTRNNEQVPPDVETKLRSHLGAELRYEDTIDLQARSLAAKLSGAELDQIATFYASPAGKKAVSTFPTVQAEVNEQLQQKLANIVPKIVSSVAPKALGEAHGSAGAQGATKPPAAQGRAKPPTEGKR